MRSRQQRHRGLASGDVIRLFDGGSVLGLGDGELLGRFVDQGDHRAFEALVDRLGPLVLGVLRRSLGGDSHEVDDAFQATFLVLVRRAGSIRDRDLVAPWLHGVASRVARRSRALAARRRGREQSANAGNEAWEFHPADAAVDRSEVRTRIDEEIGRLPESHRRLVVLCDVEGLTREEAAARLGWTLNMVRGRLTRARSRLRDRLARRGLSPSGASLALVLPAIAPRPALVASTVKGCLSLANGHAAALGATALSATALSLSQGVARMMILTKWKLAALTLISSGAFVVGTGVVADQEAGQGPAQTAVAAPGGAGEDPPKPAGETVVTATKMIDFPDVAEQLERLEASRTPSKVLLAAKTTHPDAVRQWSLLFENDLNNLRGGDRIGPVVDTSKGWLEESFRFADTREAAQDAVRDHIARLLRLVKRAEALSNPESKRPQADEARRALREAETLLALVQQKSPAADTAPKAEGPKTATTVTPGPAPKGDPIEAAVPDQSKPRSASELAKARVEVALKRFEMLKKFFVEGEIQASVDRFIAASRALMDAQVEVSKSKAERVAAIRSHHDRLKELLNGQQALRKVGQATDVDILEINSALLEAEGLLAGELSARESTIEPPPTAEAVKVAETDKPKDTEVSENIRPVTDPAAPSPPSALAAAVQAFNNRLKAKAGGEPELTVDEVLAAVHAWQADRETTAIKDGRPTNVTPQGAPIAKFKEIASTRRLPDRATLELTRTLDQGGDYTYEGWWIWLRVPYAVKGGENRFDFPIRHRLTRPVTLEENLRVEERLLASHADDPPYIRSAIQQRIDYWKQRIEYRDRGKRGQN